MQFNAVAELPVHCVAADCVDDPKIEKNSTNICFALKCVAAFGSVEVTDETWWPFCMAFRYLCVCFE